MKNDKTNKPFALVMLNKLRVVHFDTKDEMLDAMRNLKAREIECLAFRWYPGINSYALMERWD